MAKNFAKLLHTAMEIDADRAVSKAGAGGDFGTSHALDEAKDQSFAIAFGERENGVESGVGFGAGMGSGGGEGEGRGSASAASGLFDKLVERLAAAVKVRGAIASDGGEPAGEFGEFAERGEAREGLKENVLEEVVDVGIGERGREGCRGPCGSSGRKEDRRRNDRLVGRRGSGRRRGLSWMWGEQGSRPRNRSGKNGVQKECRHGCVHRDEKRLLG